MCVKGFNYFSYDYPQPSNEGFWGKGTATIDWCEENYVVSHYFAEIANTITNGAFVLFALFLMYRSIVNKFELRFILIAFGFALVGVGSWLFHMTLYYEFQLLDELPMVYATCVPAWSVFSEGVSQRTSTTIGIVIFSAANILTAIYLYFKDPTIHQVGYAIINAFIIIKAYFLTKTYVLDTRAKKDMNRTMIQGLGYFGLGYILWNLDVNVCSFWIALRRYIGLPWGLLFELHAWWHILTGIGVYNYVIYLEYLRLYTTNRGSEFKIDWSVPFLPQLSKIRKSD